MKKTAVSMVVACFVAGTVLMSFSTVSDGEKSTSGTNLETLDLKVDSVISNTSNTFKNEMTAAVPVAGSDLISDLQSRIRYPQKAIDRNIEGTVVIMFTVDTRGNVENVKLVKDIGGSCGEEACRAARTMKFKPAKQNGYTMKQDFYVPVVFSLSSLN